MASDDEFILYAVTTFKKSSAEFVHKCRESKWTPRDYKYKEGGKEEERQEVERLSKEERKVWDQALRMGRTAWGDAVMAWVHVLALRVFVETVLRYGLPLQFVCGLVRVCAISLNLDMHVRAAVNQRLNRLHQNLQRKHAVRWTSHIHIWEGKLSVGIRRAGCKRTILRLQQICRQRGIWVMEASTRRTFAMNLRSNSLASQCVL